MAKLTHLPSNCSTDDIIEVLERDGAAIKGKHWMILRTDEGFK